MNAMAPTGLLVLILIIAPGSADGNSTIILPKFHAVVLGVAGPQRLSRWKA